MAHTFECNLDHNLPANVAHAGMAKVSIAPASELKVVLNLGHVKSKKCLPDCFKGKHVAICPNVEYCEHCGISLTLDCAYCKKSVDLHKKNCPNEQAGLCDCVFHGTQKWFTPETIRQTR